MTTVLSQVNKVDDLAGEARHELLVPGAPREVFEMTRDVTRWHEYMPAVTAAEFIKDTENEDIVEITAEANDQKHTWQSRRAIDRTALTIEFNRIGATEPLVRMTGKWEFIPEGDQTRAVLTHRFATTTPEAFRFFADATRSNATRDLEGLANYFITRSAS
ncbi:MAG TPA: SRPBCC family protein [Pseudonocardiaceae bacterium]